MSEPAAAAAADADAFWEFSLALYARPGVAPACLALQDRYGLDVNIALFCCWRGWSGGGRLAEVEIAAAETRVAAWTDSVVAPLRAIRRALKPMPEPAAAAIRSEVKRLELAAEREEQRRLAGLPRPRAAATEPLADAAANLGRYLALHGVAEAEGRPLLDALPAIPPP